MARSFKCCKNKEFLNFCCISCCSIFHPSCLDRCNDVIRLGGYKILCSSICQSKQNEQTSEVSLLEERIKVLERETCDKDKHIERLRRGSIVFEDEVLDAENKFTSQLVTLKNRNEILLNEIDQLKQKEVDSARELKMWNETRIALESNIEELTCLNKNLISTIEVLEHDNGISAKEIKELRQELTTLQQNKRLGDNSVGMVNQTHDTTSVVTETASFSANNIFKTTVKRKKLLILGSNGNKGSAILFKKGTNNAYDINCQLRSKLLFAESINECQQLSKNFNKNDHIVLFVSE